MISVTFFLGICDINSINFITFTQKAGLPKLFNITDVTASRICSCSKNFHLIIDASRCHEIRIGLNIIRLNMVYTLVILYMWFRLCKTYYKVYFTSIVPFIFGCIRLEQLQIFQTSEKCTYPNFGSD